MKSYLAIYLILYIILCIITKMLYFLKFNQLLLYIQFSYYFPHEISNCTLYFSDFSNTSILFYVISQLNCPFLDLYFLQECNIITFTSLTTKSNYVLAFMLLSVIALNP